MDEHLRIVLLGKTGTGKSSLANTILGKKVFDIDHTANSGTSKCNKGTKEVNGTVISLIDTPGFFDNCKSEEELKSEIAKCIVECSPGPHAFLIFLKVEKFTEHEAEVLNKIKQYFSEEAFKYAVLVFTHGDQLPEGIEIEQYFSDNKDLCELLEKCGGRCHVFDNKYWNDNPQEEYRSNQVQMEKLLNTIKEMVEKNNRGYYSNEMLREVERRIQQEEEHIRSLSGDMSQKGFREQAKKIVSNILKMAAGVTTGMLLGALLGVSVMMVSVIVKTVKEGKVPVTGAQLGVAAGLVASAGAIGGAYLGYCAADKADSVMEAAGNTVSDFVGLANKAVQVVQNTVKQLDKEGRYPH